MKTKTRYGAIAATILTISVLACCIAWISPSFGRHGKDKEQKKTNEPVTEKKMVTLVSDESLLVHRLEADGLLNEIKGFLVEKRQDALFINGDQLPADVAAKYITGIKKEWVRVQVFPIEERQRLHPDQGFLQLVLPVLLSSPCVDTVTKRDGC